jgi:hypothetical protein
MVAITSYYDVNMLVLIELICTVQVMKDIGKTLGKKDWDFSKNPCSGENNWTSSVQVKGFENAVTCNCSFANATVCHIVSMYVCSLLSLFYFMWNLDFSNTPFMSSYQPDTIQTPTCQHR